MENPSRDLVKMGHWGSAGGHNRPGVAFLGGLKGFWLKAVHVFFCATSCVKF